ncbi:MAG: methyltransferase, partial [Oscillospiraceae bacterium]|nr:methyltransferase [Oscillospiraceae bacterium]
REPYWQMFALDCKMMSPSVNPDNIARGFVFEADPFEPIVGKSVPDMFGIEWEYVPAVGGAMVRPGNPFAEDAEELLKKIIWPEPEKWDWAGSAKQNEKFFDSESYYSMCFLNGWFERLISMLDFENALMAIFDEDQEDAVNEFFTKLTDLYIRIFGIMIDTYPKLDGFMIHDDWGGQKNTFFSPEVCEKVIVPHMRRTTDYLHSRGKNCELHSCGSIIQQVPNMIKAGWDSWMPQPMNDSHKIYELYGDKLIIGVSPEVNPEGKGEDELRAAAREYVDKFMKPGKPCFFGFDMVSGNKDFRSELYEYSRKRSCGMV